MTRKMRERGRMRLDQGRFYDGRESNPGPLQKWSALPSLTDNSPFKRLKREKKQRRYGIDSEAVSHNQTCTHTNTHKAMQQTYQQQDRITLPGVSEFIVQNCHLVN